MALATGAADLSLHILKAFGIEARNVVPQLDLSDETKRRAEKILADEGIAAASESTTVGDPEACPTDAQEMVRGTNSVLVRCAAVNLSGFCRRVEMWGRLVHG